MDLGLYIRDVADFPRRGILFRDITPLLGDGGALRYAVDCMAERCVGLGADVVVSVEARGLMFAGALAYVMGLPLVPVRKRGKLPCDTHSVSYELEYGVDVLEVHRDGVGAGQRALVVDDLLATGGTLAAAGELVRRCGGCVAGYAVVVELVDLGGRGRLGGDDVVSLVRYY